MYLLLKKIWEFEIPDKETFWTSKFWILPFVWVVGIGFAFYTVWMTGVIPGIDNITFEKLPVFFDQYFKLRQDDPHPFRAYLPYVWIGVAVIAVLSRVVIIISSYYLSLKKLGAASFHKIFSTYLITFLISTATMIFISIVSLIFYLTGNHTDWMASLIHYGLQFFQSILEWAIPFSIGIKNYWIAIFVLVLIATLPGYIVHYMSHKSRFLWLTAHRAHHVPEFLFPIAAPSNNLAILEFLLAIPGLIFYTALSGMIYSEPLIFELAIWFTLRLCLESFNHSYIHYDFANQNKIIRNVSMALGDIGVYHLVHHSAFERDQNVNFGASPLMIWDRLFGTYRKPYDEVPPIGLTDQPKVSMSPMKIVFSGFAQLWYEWKMNPHWNIRWKIIFGGVYYKPPITKDFLLIQ